MNLLPVLIAVLALAFFSGSDSLFYLAYVLAGLVILSRLWVPRALRDVHSVRRFCPRAFHGEEVAVELEVANRGRWPILWLALHESLPVSLHVPNFERRVVSLAAGERVSIRYALQCARRGYYRLGPLQLRSGDFFQLAPEGESTGAEDVLVVYPKIMALPSLHLPSRIPLGSLPTRTQFFEDPSRFFGVRDYQAGDSLRRVNWRSSAHLSRLQVKRFQPAVALRTIIFLDLNADAYAVSSRAYAEELGCTIAASIAARLMELRQQVGLTLLACDEVSGSTAVQQLPLGRGREHLMRLLEMLARARMAPTAPLTTTLLRGGTDLGWGSTALVIGAGDSPGLLESLLQMRRRGFEVVLIAMDPTKRFDELQARLGTMGAAAFWIPSERHLDLWR